MRSKVRDSEAASSFAPDSGPSLGGTRPWARHRALCPALAPPRASVSTTDLHRKGANPPATSGYVPGRLAPNPCGLGFPAPRDSLLPQSPPEVSYLILSSRSPPGAPASTKHLRSAALSRRRASQRGKGPGGGTRILRARGRGLPSGQPVSTREEPRGLRSSGAGRSLLAVPARASAAASG